MNMDHLRAVKANLDVADVLIVALREVNEHSRVILDSLVLFGEASLETSESTPSDDLEHCLNRKAFTL